MFWEARVAQPLHPFEHVSRKADRWTAVAAHQHRLWVIKSDWASCNQLQRRWAKCREEAGEQSGHSLETWILLELASKRKDWCTLFARTGGRRRVGGQRKQNLTQDVAQVFFFFLAGSERHARGECRRVDEEVNPWSGNRSSGRDSWRVLNMPSHGEVQQRRTQVTPAPWAERTVHFTIVCRFSI